MNTWSGKLLGWLSLAAIFHLGFLSPRVACAAPLAITSQPASQNVIAGSNATFAVSITGGQGTVTYQWTFNGTNLTNSVRIAGATNANLTITGIVAADAGIYRVNVTDNQRTLNSSNATLTVLFPPAITSQPTNQSILLSSNASFAVTASGTVPLGYQWQKTGVNLSDGGKVSGATTATLNLANVATNDDASYQVVVTNNYGSVTSTVATLTVLVPAFITSQPTNLSAVLNSNVSFTVTVGGTVPLAYQWIHTGTNLADGGRFSGANTATLNIANAQTNDAGSYQVLVSNTYGSVTSSIALLTILLPPIITSQPTNQNVLVSSNASFTASVIGDLPLGFQWYFQGAPLTDNGHVNGSTTTNLVIANLQTNDAGLYQLVVTNNYGTASSVSASLTVLVFAYISSQPTNRTVLTGSNVNFTVTAGGTAPFGYHWYSNGVPLANAGRFSGVTTSNLLVAGALTNDSAAYRVVVTNNFSSVTSSVAGLVVYAPVQIISQPVGKVVRFGSNVNFTVSANGTSPNFQWLFKGVPLVDGGKINGSTSPTLFISNVQAGDEGVYSVIVTNLLSAATSQAAYLLPLTDFNPGVHFVSLNSTNPQPPYVSWSTAATNIQDAVDAAADGDLVLVTNGLYQSGGKFVTGLSNRVALIRPVKLQSINGPLVTIIFGTTNGNRFPVRCAYLTNGAVLAGFTLTGGLMVSGQGVGDSSRFGGGAYCQSGTAVLTNCYIYGNSASTGGGVYQGTLNNCIISSNSASVGGGAYQSALNSCAIIRNTGGYGGGAILGTLNNCTLTGNSVTSFGGGAVSNTLNNCLVYYNVAPVNPNHSSCSLNFSCTIPLPAGGTGNFTDDPLLVGSFQISAASPCRGVGSNLYNSGVDIDSEAWAYPPSAGCDEFVAGQFSGPLAVGISASQTNVATGFSVDLTGLVSGRAHASVWNFGDALLITNHPYVSHSWTNGGDYNVTFTAYNDTFPGGVVATQLIRVVSQNVFYVARSNATPVAPYLDWETAATNIQDALDLALLPGQTVLVSNGVYETGGKLVGSTTNRVAIQRAMLVASVNGPGVTTIKGQYGATGWIGAGAVRCAYLVSGAVLDGFTLSGGATTSYDSGGGAFCLSTSAVLTNCVVSRSYGYNGGGTYSGTLNNCLVNMNQSAAYGGGGYFTMFNNCTIQDNIAGSDGGGASYGTLNNCLLTGNYGINYGGGARNSTLNNCVLDHNRAECGGGSYSSTANNCIFTNNHAYTSGGGIYNGTANNCRLVANSSGEAVYTGTGGGAAYYGTLNSCMIVGNSTVHNGGGTFNSTVNNCILTGNSSLWGGGANGGTLRNCTVIGNSGFFGGGGVQQCTAYNSIIHYNVQAGATNNYGGANTFAYCNTMPSFNSGTGNITNEPVIVNLAANDFRLQSNSPCINSGNNAYLTNLTDLDSLPRIVGGTVDIGAYEFQSPSSTLSYAWAQQYGLPTDGSADNVDTDNDGVNNWQEWKASTIPTNAVSVLKMASATNSVSGLVVTWQSVSGITYYLQRSSDLAGGFTSLVSNLVGQISITSYTDTTATNSGPYFYRVGVQ